MFTYICFATYKRKCVCFGTSVTTGSLHSRKRVFKKYATTPVKRWGLEFERKLYGSVLDPLSETHVLHSIQGTSFSRTPPLILPYVDAHTLFDYMLKDSMFIQRNTDVITQIVYMLVLFRSIGITHHDLHLNNILVVESSKMKDICIAHKMDIEQVRSPYHVLIIDFDHAVKIPTSLNKIGIQNKSLDAEWYHLGEYNQPTPGFDWFTFLSVLCLCYDNGGKHALEYMGLSHLLGFFSGLSLVYPGRPLHASTHAPVLFSSHLDDMSDVLMRITASTS
jgi:serine/threonine protein kinase